MKKTRFTEVEFQRVKVDRNDILVLTVPSSILGEEQEQISAFAQGVFPNNIVVSMREGFKLEAISPQSDM